jgi:hypothetical protein
VHETSISNAAKLHLSPCIADFGTSKGLVALSSDRAIANLSKGRLRKCHLGRSGECGIACWFALMHANAAGFASCAFAVDCVHAGGRCRLLLC